MQREGSQEEGGRLAGRLLRDGHQEAPASAGAHKRGAPQERTARVWGRGPTLRGPPELRHPGQEHHRDEEKSLCSVPFKNQSSFIINITHVKFLKCYNWDFPPAPVALSS